MNRIAMLYDYLVEGPQMGRDDAFVRIARVKPRRARATATATPKPGGIRQRRGKRCAW